MYIFTLHIRNLKQFNFQNDTVLFSDITDPNIEFSLDPNLENLQYTPNQQQIDINPQNIDPHNLLNIPSSNTIQINDIINTLKANDTEVILNTFNPSKTHQNTTETINNTFITNKTPKTPQKSVQPEEKPSSVNTNNDSLLLTFPSNEIAFSLVPNTPDLPENLDTPNNCPETTNSAPDVPNFPSNDLQSSKNDIRMFENTLVICGVCKEPVEPESALTEHKCFKSMQEGGKNAQECGGVESGDSGGTRNVKVSVRGCLIADLLFVSYIVMFLVV